MVSVHRLIIAPLIYTDEATMSRIFLSGTPCTFCWFCSPAGTENKRPPRLQVPHATVQLRDGSVLTGTVVASSPRQLVLAGDDKATRTLEMNQVKSVQYDEPPAEAVEHRPDTGAPGNAAPATKPEPAPAQSKATPPPSPPQPNAQERPHPEENASSALEPTSWRPERRSAVRTDERIDSAKAVEGQTFAAEISRDVLDTAGELVIPHGANAQIVIRSAARGGRFKGASDLVLDLKSVSIGGRMYLLDTVDHGPQRQGRHRRQ